LRTLDSHLNHHDDPHAISRDVIQQCVVQNGVVMKKLLMFVVVAGAMFVAGTSSAQTGGYYGGNGGYGGGYGGGYRGGYQSGYGSNYGAGYGGYQGGYGSGYGGGYGYNGCNGYYGAPRGFNGGRYVGDWYRPTPAFGGVGYR
jgi:hypothetical protein